ncbi:hypothetical protein [Bradyrhizobium sp.]
MNGELLPVWGQSWQEVWIRLSKSTMAPDDLFVELVGGLAIPPRQPSAPAAPPVGAFNAEGVLVDQNALSARQEYETALERYSKIRSEYETALTSEVVAKSYFRKLLVGVSSEAGAINFLELAHGTLVGYGEMSLTTRFRRIVCEFIAKFSLRYELRGDFSFHTTIPGVFTKLISEVKKLAGADPHLRELLLEFEEAFGDLRNDQTQSRIKTSLQKQFNLLEALGQKYPNVSETTLGAICNQLDWPHATIKEVGKKLYGFRSNYPGLGHGGTSSSVLRQLEMKDFVSLSLMLASLTPYLAYGLDSDLCYTA